MTALSSFPDRLARTADRVRQASLLEKRGAVSQVIGLVIESNGPVAAVGDTCRIQTAPGESILAEVVGFRAGKVLLMPLRELQGIKPGSPVVALGRSLQVGVGPGLKGRILNGLGEPMDGLGALDVAQTASIEAAPPHPLKRQRIAVADEWRRTAKAIGASCVAMKTSPFSARYATPS